MYGLDQTPKRCQVPFHTQGTNRWEAIFFRLLSFTFYFPAYIFGAVCACVPAQAANGGRGKSFLCTWFRYHIMYDGNCCIIKCWKILLPFFSGTYEKKFY